MAQQTERLAKNTTYLTVALVLQKVIAFFFFLIIARRLGGVGTGLYVSAFSFSSFFGVLVDFGLSSVLTRELARHPEKTQEYLRASIGLKVILAAIVYAVLLISVYVLDFFGANHPPLDVVAIAGLVMVFDSFVLTGTSVFRGWQNLWYESVVVVINKFAVFAIGCLMLWLVPSPLTVALSILIGGVLSLVLLTHYLGRRQPKPWLPSFDIQVWKELLQLSRPFAIAGFFATAYAQIDSILLTVLKGSEAVGLYSVAAKTMNAFSFIPSAYAAALYPAMSNDADNDSRLAFLLQQSLRYLAIISVPIAVGLFLLAHEFVTRVGQEYAATADAVRILMPGLVCMFLSFPLGALLNATNRQHWQTGVIAGTTIFNLALDIVLIPRYSFIGASWAWLAANIVMLIAGLILSRFVVHYSLSTVLKTFFKTALAAMLMGAVVFFLRDRAHVILIVPAAAIIYSLALLLSGELTAADLRELQRIFRGPKTRRLDGAA